MRLRRRLGCGMPAAHQGPCQGLASRDTKRKDRSRQVTYDGHSTDTEGRRDAAPAGAPGSSSQRVEDRMSTRARRVGARL
jgi:hypothetical protein